MSANASRSKAIAPARAKLHWWQQLLGPRVAPYLFISPFFLIFLVFWVFPVGWSMVLSFQRWSARNTTWIGLGNFAFIFSNPAVLKAFTNEIYYVIVNNLIQLTIPLFVAVLIDMPFLRRISGLLRGAYFMPNLVSGVITGVLFGIILGAGGLMTKLVEQITGTHILFLASTEWSKPAVLASGGWRWIGYWVVVYGAALQSIPDEFYEAAAMEGATLWQRFRYVTFPFLRPVILFMLVINTTGTLQIFEEPYVLFGKGGGGGPLNSALTPVLALYQLGFGSINLGAAAALGWILAIVIIIFSIVQFRLARLRGWSE